MARVIFWVDSTERIRRRMSLSVAMPVPAPSGGLDASAHGELRLGLGDGLGQGLAEVLGELLLVRDVGQELGVRASHERVQELLEWLDLLHRQIVEHSLGPRE